MKRFTCKLLMLCGILTLTLDAAVPDTATFKMTINTAKTPRATAALLLRAPAQPSFKIPTVSGETYGYEVDCNSDGILDTTAPQNTDVGYTCYYPADGNYTVTIYGDFPRFSFKDKADAPKLLSIDQWGDEIWISMADAFYGCVNMEITATDKPDLTFVTDASMMFYNASYMNSDIRDWNVSAITNMSGMFYGAAAFNQDIGDWNVSNVTNMAYMFKDAPMFNQDISSWDLSNVTDTSGMFWGASMFNQDIGEWNVSNVVNMYDMFYETIRFRQDISQWDISKVEDIDSMFYGASIPISNYDNMLIAWSQLPPYTGLSFDAGDSYYCTGESARQRLVDNVVYDWTISDLGKDCDRMRFTSPDTVNVKSGQRTVLTPTLIASEAYALGIMPGVADGDLFEIANGVLRFKSAPDHNTPADKNGDNIYRVQLVAQGPTQEDYQTLKVTVGAGNATLVPVIQYLLF